MFFTDVYAPIYASMFSKFCFLLMSMFAELYFLLMFVCICNTRVYVYFLFSLPTNGRDLSRYWICMDCTLQYHSYQLLLYWILFWSNWSSHIWVWERVWSKSKWSQSNWVNTVRFSVFIWWGLVLSSASLNAGSGLIVSLHSNLSSLTKSDKRRRLPNHPNTREEIYPKL